MEFKVFNKIENGKKVSKCTLTQFQADNLNRGCEKGKEIYVEDKEATKVLETEEAKKSKK